jgi:hypothetical protein
MTDRSSDRLQRGASSGLVPLLRERPFTAGHAGKSRLVLAVRFYTFQHGA